MEKIESQKIWSYFNDSVKAKTAGNSEIRSGSGHRVTSYMELTKKVAEIQYLNRAHLLMFRGQSIDHKTIRGNTMLKASIFRNDGRSVPSEIVLERRFNELKIAEKFLKNYCTGGRLKFRQRIARDRAIRWAILQHYEVCKTPLLDVTQSLRIAASFASDRNQFEEAFVFALGVPNISGTVTTSSEAGLQIVRLSSACPPTAIRPHIQEGYLLGEYPEIADTGQKRLYGLYELDFGRRLVAKFRFCPGDFRRDRDHRLLGTDALYPDGADDELVRIVCSIKDEIAKQSA